MSDPKQDALKAAGLPERLAPLLEGATADELEANASKLGEDLGIKPQGGPSFEAHLLAEAAIKHAATTRALFGITEEGDE